MELLNTLYVTLPESYVHLDNNTLRVELERETQLRVPLHHLGAVVCFGQVSVSLPLMHRLAEEGIALVLLDANGRFKARLEGAVSGNVLLRQAQYRWCDQPEKTLVMARTHIAAKLRNSRQVLMRGARESKDTAEVEALKQTSTHLAASLRALPTAMNLDAIRGIEGEAARQYFLALNFLVKPSARAVFRMEARSRRPPRDPMNALLSFFYSLMTNDCRSAVEAAGLDPQMGFLHAPRPGRASLALDLVEEFRIFADRLALSLINRGQVDEKDFIHREGGAVLLSPESRKKVLVAYQERKQENLTHPLLSQPVPLGLLPHVQARLIARTLRGDIPDYAPFLWR